MTSRASEGASQSGLPGRVGLACAMLVHVVLWYGLNGNFDHDYDAQQYGRIAFEISKGEYYLATHPFSQRFMVTVPTAALFRLFGVNWVTATLWPLVTSLLTIAIVHLTVRNTAGRRAALMAALLLSINLIQVRFASRLLPDVVVSSFMILAAALIQYGRQQRHELKVGFAAAVALLAALMAKATVVWAGPFFAGLLLFDLLRGRHRRMWAGFVIGVALSAAVFFGSYQLLTGDPLYRLAGIETIHNSRAGFFAGGLGQYFERLTYGPLVYLLGRPGFGLLLLLALPAVVTAARAPRSESSCARYWAGYGLTVMAAFWLGTTSTRIYTPLYLADRFLMPFLAPLAILGGLTITRVLDASERSERSPLELVPLVLGAAVTALFLVSEGFKRAVLYSVLAAASALMALRYRSSSAGPLTFLLLVAMAIPTADYAYRGDPLETPDLVQAERDFMARTFPLDGPPVALISDPHSIFLLPFYLPEEARGSVRFVSWDDPDAAVLEGERALAYVNKPRLIAVNLNWGQRLPAFADEELEWTELANYTLDGKHWVRLYEVEDLRRLTLEP